MITDLELRMTIKTLAAKGVPKRAIARQLDLSEGNVRYHLRRMAAGTVDGRSRQPHRAAAHGEAIAYWIEHQGGIVNLAALHAWLVAEHDYGGSLRSVQRYVRAAYPPPPQRARRRIETPPGAQAQADWAIFPRVIVGGQAMTLQAFHLLLSHSRGEAIVWQLRQDQLSWLSAHNGAFTRLGGIPAIVRVDNTKTAVGHGAGVWGVLNETYRRYATTVRFHIDVCAPYSPEHKGKVERAVRSHRFGIDPTRQAWEDLEELQAWTDSQVQRIAQARRCPATGSTVWEAWQQERLALAPLPILPAPFDAVATRRVGGDGLVSFEGRQYSVPFRHIGRTVEVRGGARARASPVRQCHRGRASAWYGSAPGAGSGALRRARHAPGAGADPAGSPGSTPAGTGRLPVAHRPIDLYAALAEVAR